MPKRRHHNRTGLRQVKNGKTQKFVEYIARKLNIPLAERDKEGKMDKDKYPGQDFAESNGYTLHHSTPNRSATYVKHIADDNILHLTVFTNNAAKLEKFIGMVTCSVSNFYIPGNFALFEKQLSRIISF